MKFKMMLAVVAALLMISFSSVAASADDSLTFSLTNSSGWVWAAGGGSVTFEATVTASSSNTGDLYLNGDSFNVTAPASLDDSDFVTNFFPLDLKAGDSFTGDLFSVSLPAGVAIGDYAGTFTLLGGGDFAADASLGTVDFNVAAVPEPSSIVLLLSGVAGLGWSGSKRNLRG